MTKRETVTITGEDLVVESSDQPSIDALRNELRDAREHSSNLGRLLYSERQLTNELDDKLQAQQKEHDAVLKEKEKALDDYCRSLGDSRRDIRALNTEVSIARQKMEQAQREAAKLSEKLDASERKGGAAMLRRIRELQDYVDMLEGMNKSQAKTIIQLQVELGDAKTETESRCLVLGKKIEEKTDECFALERDLIDANQKADNLADLLKEEKERVNRMADRYAEAMNEQERLRRYARELEVAKTGQPTAGEITSLKETVKHLQNKLSHANSRLVKEFDESNRLRDEVVSLQESLKVVTADRDNLKDLVVRHGTSTSEQQISGLKCERDSLAAMVNELSDKIAVQGRALKEADVSIANLKDQVASDADWNERIERMRRQYREERDRAWSALTKINQLSANRE